MTPPLHAHVQTEADAGCDALPGRSHDARVHRRRDVLTGRGRDVAARGVVVLASVLLLNGCAVVTVAGAAAGAAIAVGGAVVSTGVKAVGAVIDVASDDDDEDE